MIMIGSYVNIQNTVNEKVNGIIEPMVSVIVPVYNASEWLDRCIESIVGQQYKNLELILLVGSCDDDSLEKCIDWQSRDGRIIVVSRQDKGQGDARNYGMKLAKGKYIAFVDADDWVSSEYLISLIAPLERDAEVDVSCCGLDGIEDGIERLPEFSGKKEVDFEVICTRTYSTIWIYLYRNSWLKNNGITMFSGCHEDDAWRLELAACLKYVFFIPRALYHYNSYNVESSMHKNEKRKSIIPAMEFAFDSLINRGVFEKQRNILRNYFNNTWLFNYRISEFDDRLLIEESKILHKYFPEVISERKELESFPVNLTNNPVFFGAGEFSRSILFKHYEPQVSLLFDNDNSKAGQYCEGLPIFPYNDILKEKYTVIVSSNKYYFNLTRQLRGDGVKNILPVEEYPLAYLFYGKNRPHRFILFYTKESNNIGDCISAVASRQFLETYFPESDIIEVTDDVFRNNGRWLHKYIHFNDIIIFDGGTYLGSNYLNNGEKALRIIAKRFRNNRIIVMPQNIYYSKDMFGDKVLQDTLISLSKADDIELCLNSMDSFDLLCNKFENNITCHLLPDISLFMKYGRDKKTDKRGEEIAIVLKAGGNSSYSKEKKENIVRAICDLGLPVTFAKIKKDNPYKRMIRLNERENAVSDKIYEFSRYKAVVTDDVNCVVLCALSKTRCVAIESIDQGTSRMCSWFEGKLKYISYEENISRVQSRLRMLISLNEEELKHTFDYREYADTLAEIIKGD